MGKTYLEGLRQGQMISNFFNTADDKTKKLVFPELFDGENDIDFCRRVGYQYAASKIMAYEAEMQKLHIGDVDLLKMSTNRLGIITRVTKDLNGGELINILLSNGDTACIDPCQCEKTSYTIELNTTFTDLRILEEVEINAKSR